MKKIILLVLFLFLQSCSVTIVYAPKEVYNYGNDNKTKVTGSDLKGNQAAQKSSWFLELPFLK